MPCLQRSLSKKRKVVGPHARKVRADRYNTSITYYSHFQAFAEALQYDESVHEQQGDATVPGSPIIPISTTPRIRKVAALSDFAPVNLRVRR